MFRQIYTIKRILGQHAKEHLFVPLIVGLVILMVIHLSVDYYKGREHTWTEEILETLVHLIIVAITFLVTIYLILEEEDRYKFKFDEATELRLNRYLEGAEEYFAVSVINLKYWFEPSAQRYLRLLAEHTGVLFERALLFFVNNEIEDLGKEDLQKPAAQLFAETHYKHGIKLAYLNSRDLLEILDTELLEKIGCNKKVVSRFAKAKRKGRQQLRFRIRELDFAVVTYENGDKVVLHTKAKEKKTPGRHIEELRGEDAAPYLKLVEEIKRKAQMRNAKLPPDYDFIASFAPHVYEKGHRSQK